MYTSILPSFLIMYVETSMLLTAVCPSTNFSHLVIVHTLKPKGYIFSSFRRLPSKPRISFHPILSELQNTAFLFPTNGIEQGYRIGRVTSVSTLLYGQGLDSPFESFLLSLLVLFKSHFYSFFYFSFQPPTQPAHQSIIDAFYFATSFRPSSS